MMNKYALLIELEKKTRDTFKTCLKALHSALMQILAWNTKKDSRLYFLRMYYVTRPLIEVNNDLILEGQVNVFLHLSRTVLFK